MGSIPLLKKEKILQICTDYFLFTKNLQKNSETMRGRGGGGGGSLVFFWKFIQFGRHRLPVLAWLKLMPDMWGMIWCVHWVLQAMVWLKSKWQLWSWCNSWADWNRPVPPYQDTHKAVRYQYQHHMYLWSSSYYLYSHLDRLCKKAFSFVRVCNVFAPRKKTERKFLISSQIPI